MPDLDRFVPVGTDAKTELKWCFAGLVAAFVFSLSFLLRCAYARNELYAYNWITGTKTLREGALMPDFAELLGFAFAGFAVLSIALAALAVWHYALHRQGSRSIYLMRRLPQRLEFHIRCMTLPMCGVVVCIIAVFLLLCLYYLFYLALTPEGCLTPGQWAGLWRWF